jgi:hypothetical protein
VSCPFCGAHNQLTKDHPWPQWLRKYPAFSLLAEQYKGKRFQREEPVLKLDAEGRYRQQTAGTRHVAELLPYVQVPVCQRCNNGWMSQLEIVCQDILDPMIRGERMYLGPDDQITLATWASKCFYAYASVWDQTNIPWSPDEYRDLRTREDRRRLTRSCKRSCLRPIAAGRPASARPGRSLIIKLMWAPQRTSQHLGLGFCYQL